MKLSKFAEEPIHIKVYDVMTKEVIATFENYKRAAVGLGLTEKAINYRCNNKIRFHSPRLGKEVTCRISKKEQVVAA